MEARSGGRELGRRPMRAQSRGRALLLSQWERGASGGRGGGRAGAGRAGAAKMAYQTFRQEYLQVPPVTRAYTTACVLTTAAVVSARLPGGGAGGNWERGGRGVAVEGEPSGTAPSQSRVWRAPWVRGFLK